MVVGVGRGVVSSCLTIQGTSDRSASHLDCLSMGDERKSSTSPAEDVMTTAPADGKLPGAGASFRSCPGNGSIGPHSRRTDGPQRRPSPNGWCYSSAQHGLSSLVPGKRK